jgi:hypothetical protein
LPHRDTEIERRKAQLAQYFAGVRGIVHLHRITSVVVFAYTESEAVVVRRFAAYRAESPRRIAAPITRATKSDALIKIRKLRTNPNDRGQMP